MPGVGVEQAGHQARGQYSPQGQRGHQPVSRGHGGRQTVGRGGRVVHCCLSDADWYRGLSLPLSPALYGLCLAA